MYLLYILDTVPGYVSKSRFEESHKKQTKPATLFDMNIWIDSATTLWAVCFCKDFFLIGILSMQSRTATTRKELQEKEAQKKIIAYRKSV